MKTFISTTLVFSVLVLTLSCTKESNFTLNKSITGQWKYLYKSGGFRGNDTIYLQSNTTIILSLNADQTYITTENGQVTQQGIYRLTTLQNMFTNSTQPAIQFDYFSPTSGLLIELAEPNLTFADNHYEPFASLYIRIQ